MKARYSHASPVSWKELRDWLYDERDADFVRQSGSTHVRLRLPNGQAFNIVSEQQHVSFVVMRDVLKALNYQIDPSDPLYMRMPDLLKELGYAIVQKNKGRVTPTVKKPKRHGKGDVRRLLEQVRFKVNSLEQEIERDRDASVYDRLCGALLGADAELTGYFHEDAVIRQHVQVS